MNSKTAKAIRIAARGSKSLYKQMKKDYKQLSRTAKEKVGKETS